MNKLSNRRLARGFVEQIVDGRSPKTVISQLAAVIVESKRVGELDLILNDISSEFEKQSSVTNANVYSAHDLTTALRVDIAKLIKQTTGAKEVNIIETVEPSLLGGVRIETPDREIDLSVKNKLKSMEAYK